MKVKSQKQSKKFEYVLFLGRKWENFLLVNILLFRNVFIGDLPLIKAAVFSKSKKKMLDRKDEKKS